MINLIIGIGIATVAFLFLVIFWIMGIVKAFKGGHKGWGISTILFPFITPIFFFVNGFVKSGVANVLFFIVFFAGLVFGMMTARDNPELLEEIGIPNQTMPADN